MRVTLNSMYNTSMQSTNNAYSKLSDITKHSEKRVITASDDPASKSTIVKLNSAISKAKSYEDNAATSARMLKATETQINSYSNLLDQLSELIGEAASGTTAKADYDTISNDIKGLTGDIAQILNYRDVNGDYVFGGTITDEAPFQIETVSIDLNGDGTNESVDMYVYKGNNDTVLSKIGTSSNISTTLDGSTMVSNNNGGTIFETLAKATYYLDNEIAITNDVASDFITEINGMTEAVVQATTQIGISVRQSENAETMYTNMISQYKSMLSNEQDSDTIEYIVELQKQQQIIQVIADSTSKVLKMAEINFLE